MNNQGTVKPASSKLPNFTIEHTASQRMETWFKVWRKEVIYIVTGWWVSSADLFMERKFSTNKNNIYSYELSKGAW